MEYDDNRVLIQKPEKGIGCRKRGPERLFYLFHIIVTLLS